MALSVGMLVRCRGGDGFARVAQVDDGKVLLEYFDSAAAPVAASHWVDLDTVHRYIVELQTRVFWLDAVTGRWLAGRVVGGGPDEYFVRHSSTDFDLRVLESELRVRWNRPFNDPLGLFLASGQSSPFYRDGRLPVMRSLAKQRSATASITALTSSRIQLHGHQVRVAARILSDPVQRYLLADEVGLGKTIEAGLVIRQVLIEKIDAKVAVIAPAALCGQWESELRSRFFIDDFPQSVIAISSHAAHERWKRHADADLVVVDEAHLLVTDGDHLARSYQALESLALSARRLLLLSATPVLRREATHLALLHLLDPDVYALDKIDEFRSRLAMRKELATAVFQLDPTLSFLLPGAVQQIRDILPEDERFEVLAARALDCLDENGDVKVADTEPELSAAVSAVRAYVAETYRLHRRVLRNRRRTVIDTKLDDAGVMAPFEVTGRGRPRLISLESSESGFGRDVLDEWRRTCHDHLLDVGGDTIAYARMLAVLFSRSGGPLADFRDALAWRVDRDVVAAQRVDLTDTERACLAGAPVLPVERDVLRVVRENGLSDALTDLTARLLPRAREAARLVAFAGRGQLADDLADVLLAKGAAKVHRHTKAAGIAASEGALSNWSATGGILICDATAEDGLNLQRADAVVHLRLPAGPNELEQRIGRVDRYGRSGPAVQYVVGERRNVGLSGAWLALLLDGYRVFEESVSAYQDGIDQGLDDVWLAAFADGVSGLLDAIPSVRSAVEEEALDLARLETLEASYAEHDEARDVAASLAELEATDGYERSIVRLLEASDGFRFAVREDRNGIHVSYGDSRPLLGAGLLQRLLGVPAPSFHGHLDRWPALQRGGRLLAAGNPLVDGVWQVLQLDDRGRATAQWRVDARWQSDPLPYFAFDYHLQADLTHALAVADRERHDRSALRRRADRVFVPEYRRIWLSSDTFTRVDDERLLTWLEAPYRHNNGDVNLNAERIEVLHRLFGGLAAFDTAAREGEAAARDVLTKETDLIARTETALAALGEEQAVFAAQAVARSQAQTILVDDGSARFDEDLAAALARGVAEPRLELVAISCLVRAATPWDGV